TAAGAWTYTLNNTAAQALKEGQSLTETFTATVTDDKGAIATQVVTVTVTGTNDAPVAVANVVTPLAENVGTTTVNVTLNDTDVDAGAVLSLTGITALTAEDVTGLSGLSGADLATLTSYFTANTATGTISFNPGAGLGASATASLFDRLDVGQTATVTLSYTIQDEFGANATSTVTFTVNGAKEVFVGTPASDAALNGSDYADTIDGLGGDDIINSAQGNDIITGGDGADQINSGSEDDTITGGAGDDVINGATGTDTAIYSGAWADYTISQASPSTFTISHTRGAANEGTDSVQGVELFTFANGTFTAAQIINDAPVTLGETGGPISEDGIFTISKATLLTNDTDADSPLGDILSINVVGGQSTGTVAIVGSNVVFTPGANFNGAASFTYTVSDINGLTSVATVNVQVTAVNDAPVLSIATVNQTFFEDTALTYTLPVGTFTDVDGEALTLTASGLPSWLSFNAATRTFSGTPPLNSTTGGTVIVRATDASGASAESSFVVTVTPVNDAPVAADDSGTIAEDAASPLVVAVLTNDSDVDNANAQLSIAAVGVVPSSAGVATIVGQTVSFAPAANFSGTVVINYTVSDGASTDAGQISVTVTPVSDAPSLTVSPATGNEDTAIALNIASALTDVSEVLSITISGVPTGATLSAGTDAGGGVWTLTPANLAGLKITPPANANSDFMLTVTASSKDGTAAAATTVATILVDVTPVNDAPVAADGTATTNEDTVLNGTLPVATDVDTASLTYAVGTTAVPTKGSVLVNGDGTYSYTPALNTNGTDTFSYTVTDGTTTVEKTITVTITPVNDAPVAADGTATTNEDTVLNGTLPVATDVDTASLTYAVGTTAVPTKGSVLVNGDGTYSYTPALNANGTDTFSYTVTDGTTTVEKTITVTITPVNDAPVAADGRRRPTRIRFSTERFLWRRMLTLRR
ncbi:MAG: tandem-95 repeat protein, partial [Hyphomicrobium sp.]|nr:tandem-95 repeat protein [Hyphomicrobium sp.]